LTPDERTPHEPPISVSQARDLLRNTLVVYGVRATEGDLAAAADQLRAVLRRLNVLDDPHPEDRG
jgi:hypothetical protein